MHVVFHKESLTKAMRDAMRFVPNTTTHLYQKFVLIKADSANDRVELFAVNPDGGIRLILPDRGFGDSPAVIEQAGQCALDGRTLWEIVRKLPGDTVSFRTLGTVTTIKAGRATYDLHGMSPETFVPWATEHGGTTLQIHARDLLRMLDRTIYAAAKSDARPTLTGVHITVTGDHLAMEATDGFRLSRVDHSVSVVEGQAVDVIVPSDSLSRLAALLPNDDDEDVELQLGRTSLSATWSDKDMQVTLRGLEGRYPDTSRIIPTTFTQEFQIPRQAWLEACDRVLTICGRLDSSVAQFTFGPDRLDLTAKSPDIGHVTDQVEGVTGNGGAILLSFNVRYVMDALRSVSTDHVFVGLTGVQSAAAVVRADGDSALSLILPTRQVQEIGMQTKTA